MIRVRSRKGTQNIKHGTSVLLTVAERRQRSRKPDKCPTRRLSEPTVPVKRAVTWTALDLSVASRSLKNKNVRLTYYPIIKAQHDPRHGHGVPTEAAQFQRKTTRLRRFVIALTRVVIQSAQSISASSQTMATGSGTSCKSGPPHDGDGDPARASSRGG